MRTNGILGALLAAGALLCAVSAAAGEDLASAIDRICQGAGSEGDQAARLVSAAGEPVVSDELAAGLLKAAADLAVNSANTAAGLQAGIDAMCRLIARGVQAAYYRGRLGALCQEAYRRAKPEDRPDRAGDVMERIEAAGDAAWDRRQWADAEARYAVALRMAGLAGRTRVALDNKIRAATHLAAADRLARNAETAARAGDKAAAVRALTLCLTELDDPARAEKLLADDSSEVLRTCVPLAAMDPGQLAPAALVQLRDWYDKSLAKKTDDFGREMMFRRAVRYARLARTKAAAASAAWDPNRAAAVAEELAALSYVNRTLARLRYLDLMEMIDIDRDAGKAKWRYAEKSFVADELDSGSLVLPVRIEGSYRLLVQLAKNKKAEEINVFFPVGSRQLRLRLTESATPWGGILGGGGPRGGGERRGDDRRRGDGRRGQLLQDARHGQAGRPGGRLGGRLGGLGRGEEAGNRLYLRAQLRGVGGWRPPTAVHAYEPGYDKRPWVTYDVDISVKVEGEKAQVAVAVGSTHEVTWAGLIEDIRLLAPEPKPLTIRYAQAGVALRSARLVPCGGTVEYAYEDRAPDVPSPTE